jgi:hypothetical protein
MAVFYNEDALLKDCFGWKRMVKYGAYKETITIGPSFPEKQFYIGG